MSDIIKIIAAFVSICFLLFFPLKAGDGVGEDPSAGLSAPRAAVPHNFDEDGPLGEWPDFTAIGYITAPHPDHPDPTFDPSDPDNEEMQLSRRGITAGGSVSLRSTAGLFKPFHDARLSITSGFRYQPTSAEAFHAPTCAAVFFALTRTIG